MYRYCLSLAQSVVVLAVCTLGLGQVAYAEEVAATVATPAPAPAAEAAPAAPPPPKPKYSLPWALRPALPPNVLRSDSTYAVSDPNNTLFSTMLGCRKFGMNMGA